MAVATDERVAEYEGRIASLYAQVREWLAAKGQEAEFETSEISLHEEGVDFYTVEKLTVTLADGIKVVFEPVGCDVLGAAGRVDVRSPLGRETLVYIEDGPPPYGGGEVAEWTRRVRELKGGGWGWLTNYRHNQIPPLNDEMLADLWETLTE